MSVEGIKELAHGVEDEEGIRARRRDGKGADGSEDASIAWKQVGEASEG